MSKTSQGSQCGIFCCLFQLVLRSPLVVASSPLTAPSRRCCHGYRTLFECDGLRRRSSSVKNTQLNIYFFLSFSFERGVHAGHVGSPLHGLLLLALRRAAAAAAAVALVSFLSGGFSRCHSCSRRPHFNRIFCHVTSLMQP